MTNTPSDTLPEGFWDARYSESDQIWSGNANPQLVTCLQETTPGTALDVGCGEGGDAIWLARHGWRVTAMDVSRLALDRARAAAAQAGADIASRITWLHQDVLTWDNGGARFDLVNAHYLHFTRDNAAVHRRLASLVRPSGLLLIVGHHPSHVPASGQQHHHEGGINPVDLLFEPEAAATALDPAAWQIEVSDVRERAPSPAHRQTEMLKDTVLLARKR